MIDVAVESKTALSAGWSGIELRVSERHPCELPASCQPLAGRGDSEIQWSAVIRDVSLGGIGLILGRRFERGVGLAIEVPQVGDMPAETLLVRVNHVTSLPGGKWLLGCAFASRLSDDELRGLLRFSPPTNPVQTDAPPAPDPNPPYQSDGVHTLGEVVLEEVESGARPTRLLARQLRLKGSWPLTPGSRLDVWIGGRAGNSEPVSLRVHQCLQRDGRWHVQYTFLTAPSIEILRVFGHVDGNG
jgi:hypothetical protein